MSQGQRIRTSFLPAILLLVFATPLAAQHSEVAQSSPVSFAEAEALRHRTAPIQLIHAELPGTLVFQNSITLKVIVATDGSVESARAVSGIKRFFEQAEAIERERQFTPFEQNGLPVRALITDEVQIAPPVKWGQKMPFPQIRDWNSLRMTLSRTGCFGMCPAYEVEVHGDGTVLWYGEAFVLITGEHRGHLSREAVKGLIQRFREADYFSLRDEYTSSVTDCPTYTTSIEFDGRKKAVVDYVGLETGMPEAVTNLENAIDEVVCTEKWVRETDQTWPSLLDEHWNFKAQTRENRALFANVAAHGSPTLVASFLSAGAPALALDDSGQSALQGAAGRGDLDLVRRMLDSATSTPPQVLFLALRSAAGSGNLELVRLLIEKGADVNGNPPSPRDRQTVLMSAAQSGNAEVIREILLHHPRVDATNDYGKTALMIMLQQAPEKANLTQAIHTLIAAGADTNARDDSGDTAIFAACYHYQAVKPLAEAGANLNAKDNNGQTALMSCFQHEFIKAMLAAGADPAVRSARGLTAEEEASQIGAADKAALIEAFTNPPQPK